MQVLKEIKLLSKKINYIHYLFFILLIVIITYYYNNTKMNGSKIQLKKDIQSFIMHQNYLYLFNNEKMYKYNIKKEKKVSSTESIVDNITYGKMINGDLVVLNNNELLWIDPETLDLIDRMDLPFIDGVVTCIDFHFNKWWVCELNKESTIYCLNLDWQLEGQWRLPKKILQNNKKAIISGCSWLNNHFSVFLNGKSDLYLLNLPIDLESSKLLQKYNSKSNFKGVLAKQKGKNRSYVFDIEKDVAVKHRNEELKRIAQALKNNEFILYYQPKVDLRTNEVVGVEALIRWNHPDKGILPPIMFLPTIENDMLDIEIGNWVINTALQQSQNWLSSGYDIPISVNISPMHLQHDEFINHLKNTLNKFPNFKAESIEFEILESSALTNIELVSNVMKDCDKLGVRFSIDDFGTGYSSLTYLKRLPAKYLKIDQSFVRDMLIDKDDKAIVQGIIELAKVFNLKVIAEGVETPRHADLLLALGSYIAQGYGIAKPMPAADVLNWVTQWKQDPCLVDRSG